MKNVFIKRLGTWRDVADASRCTIGMIDGKGEISSSWKYKMLLAEHSPIRLIQLVSQWSGLKSWVSVHMVRHHVGIEHFVSTQRSDRTGVPRDRVPQSALVSHRTIANPQAILNISRKRLCNCASSETRTAWIEYLKALSPVEPELVNCCVADCIYRGKCMEYKSCGYSNTVDYTEKRSDYLSLIDNAREE